MSFKDKIVFITGGSKGIGKVTAINIAKLGANVIIADKNKDEGLKTVEGILSKGFKASFKKLDVSKIHNVKEVIKKVIKENKRIDFAINNAGISGKTAPIHELDFEDWEKTIQVNLNGVFFCMQEEIKVMMSQGFGRIVNVSSLAGIKGMGLGSAYSASKHGVVSLSKTAAIEYGKFNIRVNSVCPSFINTDILDNVSDSILEVAAKRVPLKRLGEANEVAESIIWLLDDKSSYINGHSLIIDGGMNVG
ncbi:MAG: SDR family NAD(P)-dependent oxidoreductase [Flavobacteriaceae bacterium]|nr:SDR family NAD(P)-dependent oxidoreductase [Flavobacteriaceae bacterium]